jgi:predicted DNA binding CopG/RHH family protein
MSDFDQFRKKPLNLVRQAILPGFESGQFESRPSYDQAEFKASFPEESGRRDSRVSIRVSGRDLTELQKMALGEGIPTQTFIGNIIHQYVQGLLLNVTDKRTVLMTPPVQMTEIIFDDLEK